MNGKQLTAMGRTLGFFFFIFLSFFSIGIIVQNKDDSKSHGMAISANHPELTQSASAAQLDKSTGSSSKFEEPQPLSTCSYSSQGVAEVKQELLEISTTNVISSRSNNNGGGGSHPVIMKVGSRPCKLANMEEITTIPVEEDYAAYEFEEYCHKHHHICLDSDIGMYQLWAYIGPLGLEPIALHSPDYVYHPISLALPDSGHSRQNDDLGLQIRSGEELVVQDQLLTVPQFEYFHFNDEQEELLLPTMWLLTRRFSGRRGVGR